MRSAANTLATRNPLGVTMVTSAHDPLRVPAQFWHRDDVCQALEQCDIARLFRLLRQHCGASQTRIGTAVGMTQSTVSLIVNLSKPVIAIAVLERIADGLAMPDDCRMRLGLAPKDVDSVRRRTALGIGLMAAVSPLTVTEVLRESAAEALEFTRGRAASSVGAGTLDHLAAVAAELYRAVPTRSAAELSHRPAYRRRVAELIDGRHPLKEARELYVHAADLSDLLSDLAHDLGSALTAEAYAIDSHRHADQAGHPELGAWAYGALSSWALHAGRPAESVAAAERGISIAPRHRPIAARLQAKAGRGHARLGNRAACPKCSTRLETV